MFQMTIVINNTFYKRQLIKKIFVIMTIVKNDNWIKLQLDKITIG